MISRIRSPQHETLTPFALLLFLCAFIGDERRPLHAQGREAGASVQAQRNSAALSGRGGGAPAGTAEAGVRPQLQGPQTPDCGPEARVRAGAAERGNAVYSHNITRNNTTTTNDVSQSQFGMLLRLWTQNLVKKKKKKCSM